MKLGPGTRLGPYEIVSSLGAGGMGEVYRARDSKLERYVAIKILPHLVADDPERRARFDREARALASLNHPNIAHIYGAEDAGGATAIVMELVEGEDLSARIARGPLTWVEAQPIARQLADALDAAHERGIVHRDLKPANIRITPDDTVKILDFGLAKAVTGSDSMPADPALSPTFTSARPNQGFGAAGTQSGMIMGTAAYMAPEQAKGKAVDKRADIWAFGCVLFEMLTGRSPFASDTAVESLGLVVMKEPDWSALPSSLPSNAGEILRRCLVKDPKGRLRDIGDALPLLTQADVATTPRAERGVATGRRSVLVMTLLGLTLAAAAAAIAWALKPSPEVPFRQLELPEAVGTSRSLAISPDGAMLAFISEGRLHVRALDDTTARDVGAAHPTAGHLTWSPDSRSLAWFAEGTIHTIPAGGGPVFTVCRVPASGRITGMTWHPDGTILFAAWRDNLYRVAASGGTPEVLLQVDPEREIDFHEVTVTPRNRLLVGVHLRDKDLTRIELVEPGRGSRRIVLTDETTVRGFRYVPPGFLLFRRIGANEGLWVVPYAEEELDLSQAVLVSAGATAFSTSNEGSLVVKSETPPISTLEWLDRDGSSATAPGAPIADLFPGIQVAPDGGRVAYVAGPPGQQHLFVRDLSTGADSRIASDTTSVPNAAIGAAFRLSHPAWFPGGDRLLYTDGPIESSRLFAQRADGAGEPSPIATGAFGRVSADGKWLLWVEDNRGRGQLRYAPLEGASSIGEARNAFPGSERVDIRSFDLSPDGHLLAYTTTGADLQANIHLTEFPGGGARWQVTTDGGTNPQFSHDARALIFTSGGRTATGAPEGRLVVMPLTPGPPLKLGVPSALLSGTAMPSAFTVARDGRVLLARQVQSAPDQRSRAVLVQNWPLLLRQR